MSGLTVEVLEGLFAYFDTGPTSATIEALKGIIQLAKRIARGFKNFFLFPGPSLTYELVASNLRFRLLTKSNHPHETAEKFFNLV